MSNEINPNILPEDCQLCECSDIGLAINDLHSNSTSCGPGDFCFRQDKFLGTAKVEKLIIADIKIPEKFSEIKLISKKLILTQTKVIFKHLIVEGYIIKNISYVVPRPKDVNTGNCIAYRNEWKDIEVKIPFSIGAKLENIDFPHLPEPKSSIENALLCNTMEGQCCDKGFMGESLCEVLRKDTVILSKLPFAELQAYTIKELDINRKPFKECFEAKEECNYEHEDDHNCKHNHDCCERPSLYGVLTEKLLLQLHFNIFVDCLV